MSSRSNLNAASTPSSHNVNPSANPQALQSLQISSSSYPYYSYPANSTQASAQAEYQRSDLVPLYNQYPNEQLHSFSSSAIPITGYPQPGVSTINAGAMQMGLNNTTISKIPTTVSHMPYSRINYPLASTASHLIMSADSESQSGVSSSSNAVRDINMSGAASNTSSSNFFPQTDALLIENSHLASPQTNNDFRFSMISNTDSGASNTFPESSQRTLLENPLQNSSVYHGRQVDIGTSVSGSDMQLYAIPDVASFQGQENFLALSNSMQYLSAGEYSASEFSNTNDSVGYESMNTTTDTSAYVWTQDTNDAPQGSYIQAFISAGQGLVPPGAALHFDSPAQNYIACNVDSQSFAPSSLLSPHSTTANHIDPLYSQRDTVTDSFNEPVSTSNADNFSTSPNNVDDNSQLYTEHSSRDRTYSGPSGNNQTLQTNTGSPDIDWSPHAPYTMTNPIPQLPGLSNTHSNPDIALNSANTSSRSFSRPAMFYRHNSEMAIPRMHPGNLGIRTNVRSNSIPMTNYSESIQEQSQLLRHFQSYPRIIPAPALRTPTSSHTDISSPSSLSGQLLLTPPFLVGSSPLPPATTSTATPIYGALGPESSSYIRERSTTPTQSSTSARARQQSLKSGRGRKRKEMSSASSEDFGQEGSIDRDTSSQVHMNTPLEMHTRLPQTPVYPRLPSFSHFLPQSSPLPIILPQSSTSQSVDISITHRNNISLSQSHSTLDVLSTGQRKRPRSMVISSIDVSEDEELTSGASTSETNINSEHRNNNLEVRRGRWQLDLTSNYMYTSSPSMAGATTPNADFSPLTAVLETSLLPPPFDSTQSILPISQLEEGQVSAETVDQPVQTNEETTNEAADEQAPVKKVKMHQCVICKKFFPRPSGLATHMNSHSGARPYKCPLPYCAKSFAVRSNARRHMRTHGGGNASTPSSGGTPTVRRRRRRRRQSDASESESEASDGEAEVVAEETKPRVYEFETPVVVGVGWPLDLCLKDKDEDEEDPDEQEDEEGNAGSESAHPSTSSQIPIRRPSKTAQNKKKGKGKMAPKLKWVPQSLQSRANAARLRSMSPGSDMWDVDGDADGSSEDDEYEHKELVSYQASPSTSQPYDTRHFDSSSSSRSLPRSAATSSSSSSIPRDDYIYRRTSSVSSATRTGKAVRRHPVAPAPLPPVAPSSSRASADLTAKFEERNSYAEAGTHPYHPAQWRTLPGPALVPSLRG